MPPIEGVVATVPILTPIEGPAVVGAASVVTPIDSVGAIVDLVWLLLLELFPVATTCVFVGVLILWCASVLVTSAAGVVKLDAHIPINKFRSA